jgi:hypothetical protein
MLGLLFHEPVIPTFPNPFGIMPRAYSLDIAQMFWYDMGRI